MKKGYSYSLLINQVPIVELGYDEIDIIDMAIYEEIVKIMSIKGTVIMRALDGDWYWISHSLLITRLPLLRIKSKPTLIRRINKLIERNMILRHGFKGSQKTYYQLTEFHQKYITFSPSKNEAPLPNLGHPSFKNETPPPSNLKDNDIIINDSTTNEVGMINEKSYLSISFKKWTHDNFVSDIDLHKKDYPREELVKFYNHWAEKDPKGKMLFQLKDTWETNRRLITWMGRNYSKSNFKSKAKSVDGFQAIIDGQ